MARKAKSTPAPGAPAKNTDTRPLAYRGAGPRRHEFPIVGIGASAGGLEALEHFIVNVPAGSGMAFIIVQHLDPNHKGLLPELLQRITPMRVTEAEDGMPVEPDCVYIIPPNKDLSILHGALFLLDPVAPRGMRLPIDFFFRSLAEERRDRAIAVILSGLGSDGTQGLRAIKDKFGLVLVQEPADAKYDSMPRSVIDADLADVVAPAAALPRHLLNCFGNTIDKQAVAMYETMAKARNTLEKVVILLRQRTNNDFSHYKKNTLYRRIERRMALHQINSIQLYAAYLRENPQELDLLFKELLIGVTSFFRDPAVWDYLKNKAIPDLLAAHPGGRALRAWVAACSTGEEAFSLAIAFREAVDQVKPAGQYSLQIFATDLDPDAIERARRGFYRSNITADVPPELLARYFTAEGDGYQVNKTIRDMVIFAPQNLISDPPFTRLDILSCRNLLIYLDPELQKKLMPLFHYALCRNGLLLLGGAETVGGFGHLFSALDPKARLYLRTPQPLPPGEVVVFPTKYIPQAPTPAEKTMTESATPPANMQLLVNQLLLQSYAPPAVLINNAGDILYISGRTGKFLEPAAGKANWNIHVMARDGLREVLSGAIRRALQQRGPLRLEGLPVDTGHGRQNVDLTVQALEQPPELRGNLMLTFTEVAAPAASASKPDSPSGTSPSKIDNAVYETLVAELQQVRTELQTSREERQTTQEELKSTNEELQSINEELQSANEELTTSKEEMQSMNEELLTVNAELQSKVDDMARINADMKNLLNSTEIATVFLDNEMKVRRFTTHATQLFKLIPNDIGRPLSDIVTDLDYPELQQDAHQVLASLLFSSKQVRAHDGRWFMARIMPYRTLDNMIDGVVITFTNISEAKAFEAELRKVQEAASDKIES